MQSRARDFAAGLRDRVLRGRSSRQPDTEASSAAGQDETDGSRGAGQA